ncbi:unnamed protein product, partial [Didymodactylos carnosus]
MPVRLLPRNNESQDLQKVVFSKYEKGDGPTKIFRDLNGGLSLATIKRWCKMIRDTGTIQLSYPPGRSRVVHTSAAIQKVKSRLRRKKNVSVRKLSRELNISRRTVGRILKNDLKCHPYKKIIEPKLTDSHKAERKKFANWVRNNFQKEQIMKILFLDEKIFDINGVYNSQNDRIWAVDRAQADTKGGRKQVQQFPQKV